MPVSSIGGWYDIFLSGQLRDFQALHEAERPVRLTIGPWTHAEFRNVGVLEAIEFNTSGRRREFRRRLLTVCVPRGRKEESYLSAAVKVRPLGPLVSKIAVLEFPHSCAAVIGHPVQEAPSTVQFLTPADCILQRLRQPGEPYTADHGRGIFQTEGCIKCRMLVLTFYCGPQDMLPPNPHFRIVAGKIQCDVLAAHLLSQIIKNCGVHPRQFVAFLEQRPELGRPKLVEGGIPGGTSRNSVTGFGG